MTIYPDWAYYEDAQKHKMAFLPDATHQRVTFTGTGQPQVLNNPKYTPEANNKYEPVDIPDATEWNTSYATYSYDVTAYYDDTKEARNRATAERLQYPDPDYRFGIAGMALLIVYEDPDAPLTRYWVADDRDLIMAKTDSRESTGFEYEECTRKVQFEGAITDPHLANVSLKTVLVSYAPNKALCSDAGGIADALYFNPSDKNNPSNNRVIIETGKDDGHWHKVEGDIALTNENEGWAYVNVQKGIIINYAAIQSRGAMMGVAHAILKVTYPPDLVPSVDTPLRATVGNPYYIPITITNLGKSTAKKIEVHISIEGEGDHNEIIEEVPGAGQEGGNKETIRIEKIAPPAEGIITFNVTVVVDPDNKVPELITKSHDGEANNNITKKVTLVVQSGILVPRPGGGGGGGSGESGWGTGTGTGEGSGEGEGTGVAGGTGEGEERETGGKTITGRLMKGIVPAASQEAGGGGEGEFSLIGLLVRLGLLAVAIALVYAGYRYEKRIHKPKI